jgi:hypothetical protein
MIDEALRHIDGDHLAAAADQARQLKAHVTGPATHVKQRIAGPEAPALPAARRLLQP